MDDYVHKQLMEDIKEIREEMREGFKGVHARQDYANGKTNKIIVALVFAFGLIMGLGILDIKTALALLL